MMTLVLPAPTGAVRAVSAYAPTRHAAPCDLNLAGTEASDVQTSLLDALDAEELVTAARYPDTRALQSALAALVDVDPARVFITAGADDALDRICRAVLTRGRNAIITDPTFEMIPRYVRLSGAAIRSVPWPDGALPVDDIIVSADERTALVAIVTPNNPTGAVASFADIRRVHDEIPSALILVDLAYVEFADTDNTAALLSLPRVVVVRTMSKAWGLPGLRVGYALGAHEYLAWMRQAGSPYPVSSVSLALATRTLESGRAWRDANIARVRTHRAALTQLLKELGACPNPSEANFVTVVGERAQWVHDALAGLAIATRLIAGGGTVRGRITVPTNAEAFARLCNALHIALAPQAILFDLDGVIADVSQSYREAIRRTAEHFGVRISSDDIARRKALGNANDDWLVTTDLINAGGVRAALDDVKAHFERLYQGDTVSPGLRDTERMTVTRDWLASLAERFPLAIVTGRPRSDAEYFLARFGVRDLFCTVVTRDDGPIKPDAFPVATACRALGVTRAWMIGDTPDDVISARRAGALPIGVVAPGDSSDAQRDLPARGAARVLTTLNELIQCLP